MIDFWQLPDEDGGTQFAAQRLSETKETRRLDTWLRRDKFDRRLAAALESLLAIVAQDRRFRDDGARKAMAALFGLLGPNSDLSYDFRRRLQAVVWRRMPRWC